MNILWTLFWGYYGFSGSTTFDDRNPDAANNEQQKTANSDGVLQQSLVQLLKHYKRQ